MNIITNIIKMLKCDSKSSCLTLSHLCLLCAARAESDQRPEAVQMVFLSS